ncbi:MAG: serine/threonine-protein kinase, partial [Oscillospiraceae bacterium]|nr:serine/threonine-protein kinase [Oscillospiraceae bacterium]
MILQTGSLLTSRGGTSYKVLRLLGSGAQGEIYEAERDSERVAVKWYFPQMASTRQKSILENLIANGVPDASFIWPEDIVSMGGGNPFGYVMELMPSSYKGIVDLLQRAAEPTFSALCKAAFNLTRGFQKLHALGYSYRDISFGNVFFNPDNGDVLICDNDNVSANGADDTVISGTPRFMAPEIITGKAKPSRNTDLFSLAVLLFYMFMIHHPLEGAKEAGIKCLDTNAMNMLFGTDPVFIFDPNDVSNRPVEGYQDNAIIYWGLYPQKLRDLFTASFTVGLDTPNRRVTETQWLDAFTNLITGIFHCPRCGAEIFFDETRKTHTCWGCGADAA